MKYVCSLIVLVLTLSCSTSIDDTLLIGEDFVNTDTKVFFTDTFTVKASTFKFDSINVSNNNRLLIGAYSDPVFGKTKSKSFVQLNNYQYDIDNETVFDSIALILHYDHYYYNDTIPEQIFNVYRVLEDIKSKEDYYYNTTTFQYSNISIATKNFEATPVKVDSLHIELNDAFGSELFAKLRDNEINNNDEFIDEYKGLVIEPEINNTTVLGFLNTSVLRVYYSIIGETENTDLVLDITFNTENSFNQTSSESSGTSLESLLDQEVYLDSQDANNNCFIQSGGGVVSRIDVPYLDKIYDIPGTGIITDADLVLNIKNTAQEANYRTRDSLQAFIINQKSEVVYNLTNFVTSDYEFGLIEDENQEFNILKYRLPIKQFLDLKLDNPHEDLYLAIYPQDFAQSVDRYIFYDANAPEEQKLKLELTYAIYEED
ncbi:DUF4270 family protein [Pontimicrobium sp. IMCC45349]|uniref:DUF4270 family protein n=1 Tax=Pontimicrobium sp. IMCC45349 TaxID=3391574 RepID=UPI0039A34CF6